jgi:CRP-like cAMP-binding protein
MYRRLKTARLFAELDDDALREISAAASPGKAAPGEMIFNDGEPAESFYIVTSGKVKVYKLSPEGKEQILMIAQPGDTFAEAAMFAGGEFPASAEALEPTELIVINRARFAGLLQHRPDVAMNLIARLAGLLRQMTRLIEALSLSDVNTRLARYLTTFRDIDSGRQLTEIHLMEKKTVLASQLGTIPETLSRAFAKLSKDGVIRVDGPNITVVDPKRLEELANPGQ